MKKILSMILVCLTVICCALPAYAHGADAQLRFDEHGEFTILHLTDWHTDYPLPALQKQLVIESLAAASPDLVVLGGDLSEASHEDQPAAGPAEGLQPFQRGRPQRLAAGHHDRVVGHFADL